MEDQKQLLLYQSVAIGSDSTLIQGAGGNVSFKAEDALVVKGSGTCLREAGQRNILVQVSRKEVLALLERDAESFASLASAGGVRPSIETPLHALMPHTVVVHAHCVNTIARTVMGQDYDSFDRLLDGLSFSIVPYKRPGLPLACTVRDVLRRKMVDILILQNHGIIVGGNNVESAFALLYEVQKKMSIVPRIDKSPDLPFLQQRNDLGWAIPESPHWHSIATDAASFACACVGPLYPDHVVFLGGVTPVAHQEEPLSQAVERFEKMTKTHPRYMLYENGGILTPPDLLTGEADMLDALAHVCSRVKPDGSLVALSESNIVELHDWDAEKFRKMVSRGRG